VALDFTSTSMATKPYLVFDSIEKGAAKIAKQKIASENAVQKHLTIHFNLLRLYFYFIQPPNKHYYQWYCSIRAAWARKENEKARWREKVCAGKFTP